MKNIVLIGMSGVGKTVVGKYISDKSKMKLIDTDEILTSNSGKSISYIFDNFGEEYFRNLESKTIESVSMITNSVISTGGGVVLNKNNISNLRKNGVVFLLESNLETLIRNINLSKEKRPLLSKNNNTKKNIKNIKKERQKIYNSNADYIIKVDNKSINEIGNEIINIFK